MPESDDVLDDVYEWWTPPIRRLPPMLVQRVVMDLGSYVVRRGAGECLGWYHRQFWEAVKARYCSSTAVREILHTTLATSFGNLILDEVLQASRWSVDGQVSRYGSRVHLLVSFLLLISSFLYAWCVGGGAQSRRNKNRIGVFG